MSPLNPKPTANYVAARGFSDMVDPLPSKDNIEWVDTGDKLSEIYPAIVNGAVATTEPDPNQQAAYDKAYAFLNAETKIPNVDGPDTVTFGPSPLALTYNQDQSSYITAIGGYRAAQNGYDMSNPTDQRAWMAVAPGLQNNVDQSWNKWVREGKANVEKAQALLATSINDAVRNALLQAQGLVSDTHKVAALTPTDNPWFLSYGQPTNWMDPKCEASKITLRSAYLNETSSAEANSYSAGGSASYGLWSVGGGFSHSDEKSNYHMDSQKFELSAELIQVRVTRPWYNPLIFRMRNWKTNAYAKGEIAEKAMPWVATSLIIARNVTINADFSADDKSHFSSQSQASGSVGWGPFSVSSSWSHSESTDTAKSTFDAGGLHLPGLQVIGFVCSATPPSPPQ